MARGFRENQTRYHALRRSSATIFLQYPHRFVALDPCPPLQTPVGLERYVDFMYFVDNFGYYIPRKAWTG